MSARQHYLLEVLTRLLPHEQIEIKHSQAQMLCDEPLAMLDLFSTEIPYRETSP